MLILRTQVGQRTYKIHRYFLIRESSFFRDMFSLPQGDSSGVEGADETQPIIIPDTTTTEFDCLLRFFYFGMHSTYSPTLADWMELLSISTRLLFDTVCARAIQEITSRMNEAPPFDLIALASKHDVKKWLKPAYQKVVMRTDLITEAEARKIPFPIAVMLTRSRERYRCQQNQQKKSHYTHHSSTVDGILDSEIKIMEQASGGSEGASHG
ncbi:hypothetical protein BJV78DRAFT_1207337 [Lactifluus subvellereus]|nr:hypothetical protein BJV78DRAFT_1207337 [Lactifluus subvellereus]